MISYQWDSQPEVMKIYEALKGYNFNIWIDIDKMSGDIYKKIADGVEGAEVIIVCMSSKYQESENCNSEFKYARDNRKNIIPIKMEKGFNATGPLGLITAGKHYIDFSNWSMFDNNMKRLKKEIESYIRSTGMSTSHIVNCCANNIICFFFHSNAQIYKVLENDTTSKFVRAVTEKNFLMALGNNWISKNDHFYKCQSEILLHFVKGNV